MLVSEIIDYLESICPSESAEGWDNPGLLVGTTNKELTKCVICLDATSEVVEFAVKNGANLIVSHHPLIFGGINSVTDTDPYGKIIISMIENNITLFSMHTNLDKYHELSNMVLASKLGAINSYYLDDVSCGVFSNLGDGVDFEGFSSEVNVALGNNGVIAIGAERKILSKAFVQGGSFDEDSIPFLLKEGVDVVVSGEIKHHITLLLKEYGIASIIAGHKATEDVFMPALADVLINRFTNTEFLLSL